jgi:hypothetical protein
VIKYGHLDIDVDQQTLLQLQFEDLHQCYRQYRALDEYYNQHNSSIWQMFDNNCPEWVWSIAKKLIDNTGDSSQYVVSVIRLDPGNTVPDHCDAHFKVQEKFGTGDTARYLIFLDDWCSGHYYEIQQQPHTKWRRGDWVKFGPDDWHLAGNMGAEPFYSMQVTIKT